MAFIHNLNPVLFDLPGPIDIRWYSLAYVAGFVAAYIVLRKVAQFSQKEADSLVLSLMVGMLIGARIFFFTFYRPDLFSLLEFFQVWHGGMSFHGGFVGVALAALWWCRQYKKNFWLIADTLSLVTPWFLALGRFANFINGEIVGPVFNGWWCVQFPGYDQCRHPTQLYALFKDVLLGSYLLLLHKATNYRPGFIFWNFVTGYGILRFLVNFLRDDPALIGWLKMGHVLSIFLIVVGGYMLWNKHSQDFRKLFKRSI